MSRVLPVVLIELALSFPLFGAIANEIPVSVPEYGAAPGEQIVPIVGSDGENFLAAWRDQREAQDGIYAARFDANGKLLDPTGIRITVSNAAGNRRLLGIFSIDGNWVVLWAEQTFSQSPESPQSNVMAVRIDSDGNLIDGPRVAISGVYPSGWLPAATDGSRILVAYDNTFALLDGHANLLSRDVPLPIPPQSGGTAPNVASDGSDFLIVWSIVSSSSTVYVEGIVVDGNGQAVGLRPEVIVTQEMPVALASDGSNYVLITQNWLTRGFLARRLAAASQTFDAPASLPAVGGIPNVSGDLIWTGTSYLFATGTTVEPEGNAPPYQQQFGIRVDRSGNPIDGQPFPISEGEFGFSSAQASVASNGTSIASVWHSMGASSADDAYATLVDPSSLRRSDPVLLSRSANQQTNPSIAFGGRNDLAAWQETTGTYIGRVSLDGQPLDGRGIRISSVAYSTPKVIFDGTNYVVGWITTGTNIAILWGTRVTPDGEVLDGDGIALASSTCAFNFDLLNTGDRTFVAWDDCDYKAIHVERIDRDLHVLDVPLDVTPAPMQTARPALAWNGSEVLVAFQEEIPTPSPLACPSCFTYRSNVRAVRISNGLTLLDTDPLRVALSDSDDQHDPYVASNGDGFAVGWTRSCAGGSCLDVDARTIAADGTLGSIATLAEGELSSVIWDGSRYTLAYANGNAYLTHLGTGDRMVISATRDVESTPRLVLDSDGHVGAAYVRIATEPLYGGVARVFLRDPTLERAHAARH